MEPCGAGLTRIGPTLIDRLLVLENQAAHLSVLADVANARRTAASHQFGRYQRHSGHAANSSGASIRCF